MKKLLLSAAVLSVVGLNAQEKPGVGIEESNPKATLDVGGDLRVQSVPEVGSLPKEDYKDCPCLLLIDKDGKMKRYGNAEALKALGINSSASSSSDGSAGAGSGAEGGAPENGSETPDGGSGTQPGQGTDPNKVDGTAKFSTLSNAEAFVLSLDYGNGAIVNGEVTNTGVTVEIPYTSSQAGKINAVTIPVQTGGDSKLKLKIPETTIRSGSGAITATIVSEGGTYSVPKVTKSEIDAHTWNKTVATFKVKVKGVSNPATITLKALGGIPDKLFGKETNGKLEHQFIYLPVKGPDGKWWLNNNLGADYARVNNPVDGKFDPTRQAKNKGDFKAYGSSFQYGRFDRTGYELMNWRGTTTGSAQYPNKGWKSSSDLTDTNWNPCPDGFRLPTEAEVETLRSRLGSNPNNVKFASSTLKLPAVSYRDAAADTDFAQSGTNGRYWSSTPNGSDEAMRLYFYVSGSRMTGTSRSYGYAVRCLKK